MHVPLAATRARECTKLQNLQKFPPSLARAKIFSDDAPRCLKSRRDLTYNLIQKGGARRLQEGACNPTTLFPAHHIAARQTRWPAPPPPPPPPPPTCRSKCGTATTCGASPSLPGWSSRRSALRRFRSACCAATAWRPRRAARTSSNTPTTRGTTAPSPTTTSSPSRSRASWRTTRARPALALSTPACLPSFLVLALACLRRAARPNGECSLHLVCKAHAAVV